MTKSERAFRVAQEKNIHEAQSKESTSDDENVQKPSEIRERQREIKDKIERLENRIDNLGSQHHKMCKRYVHTGAPCPECGSKEKPKGGGWGHSATAECPDCGFTARVLD